MTITIGLQLLVCLLGLVLYLVAKNGKVSETGRIMFFVGLFWVVHEIGSKTLHI